MKESIISNLKKHTPLTYIGGRCVTIKQFVINGPKSCLDRNIDLRISFEEFEKLIPEVMKYKEWFEKSMKKLEEQNIANQGDQHD